MFAIIVAGLVTAVVLLLILARYAKNPAEARLEVESPAGQAEAAALEPNRFFYVVQRLLAAMDLEEVDVQTLAREGAVRIEAVGVGARPARYVVYAFAKPRGEEVDANDLLRVADDVLHSRASRGLVITPYRIDSSATAGIDVDIDLVDGLAMLQLIDEHAPELRADVAGRLLRGETPPRTRSTAPEPRFVAAP